ncbi:transcription termination factor 3, mitochondrial-like [Argiope bruennichi]|uniref:transcription termination factor 3, mitochondrial-like n=1 Tax=Argiope bruennichi TaxID=94029 RepID=UPI00249507B4|nr:transcription termination factor 3, mitochondrial-like [Argiope bruennichi]XP_055937599.1 transcription termination factor 3, mitochondrial-like [Argiope bruennichi]XP_055937600.1 transcription termination factor 3, mitochondrial-like [Argiope bruennichi]XP_055937601.1 transcription termination factor 3, mitochondrial-like [Argiope bruennichi]XP_055937602.1 transcription termination factor 3, mitochondrial-like [Argiope bruennichi]
MFRILMKQCSNWRFLSTTISRLNDASKLDIIINSKHESQKISDLSDEGVGLQPPVFAKPFAELEMEETKNMPSEIGEFVDSLGPPLPITFNLAAYANHSESLQKLIHLGVDLSEIEKRPDRAKFVLNLDFEKNVKNHIQFLYDNGVSADDMGRFFTKNPFIFKERIEDLEVRINYLKSKKFTSDAIAWIITSNPYFLSLDTKQVDFRLGFFQKQFSLTGNEVRHLITKCPKLVTYSIDKFREKLFSMKEELGFTSEEMKKLLLMKPKVWMLGRSQVKERFDVVHNLMGIPHETIIKFPEIFTRRAFITKQRHLYLVHLNRAQYDPTQPLYVSLRDLVLLSDCEFCEKCARTSIDMYNEFLKTL